MEKEKGLAFGRGFSASWRRRSPAILARLFAGISLVFRSPFARSSARLRCSRFPAPSSQLPEVFAMKWIEKPILNSNSYAGPIGNPRAPITKQNRNPQTIEE
jgi:hypothetical protein